MLFEDNVKLEDMSAEERKEEICKLAVQQDWEQLEYVPKDKLTEEICIIAVKQDCRALEYIPKEKCTERVCIVAVQKNRRALEYVPEEMRTEEICVLAVQQEAYNLRYVPKEKCTEEICILAVQQAGYILELIPKEKYTEKMCTLAVKQDWEALKYVPEEKKAICESLTLKNDIPTAEAITKDELELIKNNCIIGVESYGVGKLSIFHYFGYIVTENKKIYAYKYDSTDEKVFILEKINICDENYDKLLKNIAELKLNIKSCAGTKRIMDAGVEVYIRSKNTFGGTKMIKLVDEERYYKIIKEWLYEIIADEMVNPDNKKLVHETLHKNFEH